MKILKIEKKSYLYEDRYTLNLEIKANTTYILSKKIYYQFQKS